MRHRAPVSVIVAALLLLPLVAGGTAHPTRPSRDARPVPGPEDAEVRELVRLVNLHRTAKRVRTLRWSSAAARVAFQHSIDMRHRDYFSHANPDGQSPFDRLERAGVRYVRAGENIAFGYRSPEQVLQGWLESPGHRKNLENPKYTHHGVGLSGTMWTHVFLTPPR